jgi:hypothetical protein
MNKLQAFYFRLMKYHDIDNTIKYQITKDYEFIKNHFCLPTDNDGLQSKEIPGEQRTDIFEQQSEHTSTTTNK